MKYSLKNIGNKDFNIFILINSNNETVNIKKFFNSYFIKLNIFKTNIINTDKYQIKEHKL